jgi:hypothetical protein
MNKFVPKFSAKPEDLRFCYWISEYGTECVESGAFWKMECPQAWVYFSGYHRIRSSMMRALILGGYIQLHLMWALLLGLYDELHLSSRALILGVYIQLHLMWALLLGLYVELHLK